MGTTIRNCKKQIILTCTLPQTDTLPRRVKATATHGIETIVEWDWTNEAWTNHAKAAEKLIADLGWEGDWVAGLAPTGYVFVDVS